MLVRRYEMPWRQAFEVYAGITWWLALVYFVGVGVIGALPRPLALPLALVCFAMGVLRVVERYDVKVLAETLLPNVRAIGSALGGPVLAVFLLGVLYDYWTLNRQIDELAALCAVIDQARNLPRQSVAILKDTHPSD